LTRATTTILPVLVLALLLAGCDWYGQDEVALRPLPYPYGGGVAIDDGSASTVLAGRGVTFVFDGEEVGIVGQDAACSLVDRGRQLWSSLMFLYKEREWRGGSFFSNKLLEPVDAEDAGYHAYKRYVGRMCDLPPEMPSDVAAQVAEAVAYEITAKGGVMIVAGSSPGRHGPSASVIDHLRLEHQRGRVYYVERDRLLAYSYVRRYLDWSSTSSDDGVTIRIRSVDDGEAPPWVPMPEELTGITFYTPDPERTRVLIAGEEVLDVTSNAPDWTKRGSVTIGSPPGRPPDTDV
jgi:hypothetical protein